MENESAKRVWLTPVVEFSFLTNTLSGNSTLTTSETLAMYYS